MPSDAYLSPPLVLGLAFDVTPVLIFLAAAVIAVPLFKRIKASPVLAYLAAGAAIGPYALGFIEDLETTQNIGEFGVIFLLFAIGLELQFDRLKAMGREVFGLGTTQVLLTALLIGGGAYALGASVEVALIAGGGLAFSSTAMVMQLLAERGEASTRAGHSAFSILLLQDLAVVPLLALMPLLAVADHNILAALANAGLKAVAALVGLTLLGRLILRPVYRVVAGTRSPELFVGASLLVVLGTSWATAQAGLSLALGAFLAGLLLSETEYVHQIKADIEPFRGLFLGLFFMSVGMTIDFRIVLAELATVAGLVVLLIVMKGLVIAGLCRLFRLPAAVSVQVGFLLAQCGEFAFVLFGLAAVTGVMPQETAHVLIVSVGLTMVAPPAMAALGKRAAQALERRALRAGSTLAEEAAGLSEHILVAGFGRVGQIIGRLFEDHGIPYLALDLNQDVVDEGRARGRPVFYGNAGQGKVLEAAGAMRARGAVITLDQPTAALRAVEAIRRHCPHGTIMVRARDRSHSEALRAAGATAVVPEILEASLQLAGQTLLALGVKIEVVDESLKALRADDYAPVADAVAEDDRDADGIEAGKKAS